VVEVHKWMMMGGSKDSVVGRTLPPCQLILPEGGKWQNYPMSWTEYGRNIFKF